jgi:hypothetical protein
MNSISLFICANSAAFFLSSHSRVHTRKLKCTTLKILKQNSFESFQISLTHKVFWKAGEHHLKWGWPGSEDQKLHVFFHMWNIDIIQMQQYCEILVMSRGDKIWEGEGKRRKLRRWIWLMYSLYKNVCKIFFLEPL